MLAQAFQAFFASLFHKTLTYGRYDRSREKEGPKHIKSIRSRQIPGTAEIFV